MRCVLAMLVSLAAAAALAQVPATAQPTSDGAKAAAPESADARVSRNALRVRVRTEALRAGLPAEIADAVATVESSYNARAIGGVGEIGLMQVLPSTARLLGFQGSIAELAEPDTNIRYGVAYLVGAWRLADSDLCTTVMKYRAGHAEDRFSYRSVDYCLRVRAVLKAQGYPLFGEVPAATFGEPVAGGGAFAARPGRKRLAARSGKGRINWAAADARMRAITSKVNMASLAISR
jgi:soluble lytic murein transglycosylase-like protein